MIYLLELPKWEVLSIPINAYGYKTFKAVGKKKLSAFNAQQQYGSGSELKLDVIYKQQTFRLELVKHHDIAYWAEVTFLKIYIKKIQQEFNNTILYTCEAMDFMITLQSTDEELPWLEREALMIDRKNYLNIP